MRSGNSSFRYVVGALLIVGTLLCLQATLMAQESRTKSKVLAQTPPMGWNSWDSYGLRINERQFRENVEAMATKLKPFGYTYALIDEGWYMDSGSSSSRAKPDRRQRWRDLDKHLALDALSKHYLRDRLPTRHQDVAITITASSIVTLVG